MFFFGDAKFWVGIWWNNNSKISQVVQASCLTDLILYCQAGVYVCYDIHTQSAHNCIMFGSVLVALIEFSICQ